MNSGVLPMVLLCATAGLLLGLAPFRVAWMGFAAMVGSALFLALIPLPPRLEGTMLVGLLLSVIGSAALTYFSGRLPNRWMILAGVNAGVWVGALASATNMRGELLLALPLGLLLIPAGWFTSRNFDIVIKVIASWMIAIATLSIFVSLVATPGYKPDHME